MERRLGKGELDEGVKKYKLQLELNTRDAMYNMINIINTVVWSGRSSGEGNGSLGNIMDRGAWQGSMGVTKEFNTA